MDTGLNSPSHPVPELLISSQSQTVLLEEDQKQMDEERIRRIDAKKEEQEVKEQKYVTEVKQISAAKI